jgi:hypothetical protein
MQIFSTIRLFRCGPVLGGWWMWLLWDVGCVGKVSLSCVLCCLATLNGLPSRPWETQRLSIDIFRVHTTCDKFALYHESQQRRSFPSTRKSVFAVAIFVRVPPMTSEITNRIYCTDRDSHVAVLTAERSSQRAKVLEHQHNMLASRHELDALADNVVGTKCGTKGCRQIRLSW